MYALEFSNRSFVGSPIIARALSDLELGDDTETHARRMQHLFAIERLEARGHQYATHADDVLRAAFNFLDAVAPDEADQIRAAVGRKPAHKKAHRRAPQKPLPLFTKQAAGAAAAELVDAARAVDAPRTWPHGFTDYKQRVYDQLERLAGADMPWPAADQIIDAMDRGILPGDYAAALIRADLARVG